MRQDVGQNMRSCPTHLHAVLRTAVDRDDDRGKQVERYRPLGPGVPSGPGVSEMLRHPFVLLITAASSRTAGTTNRTSVSTPRRVMPVWTKGC
jgi:hypothetical protein